MVIIIISVYLKKIILRRGDLMWSCPREVTVRALTSITETENIRKHSVIEIGLINLDDLPLESNELKADNFIFTFHWITSCSL